MTFEGALVKEQGVTFAIVIVKPYVVQNHSTANKTAESFQSAFPGCPIILMAQDSRGRATYLGRPDIVKFLSRVPLRAIPWKKYHLN